MTSTHTEHPGWIINTGHPLIGAECAFCKAAFVDGDEISPGAISPDPCEPESRNWLVTSFIHQRCGLDYVRSLREPECPHTGSVTVTMHCNECDTDVRKITHDIGQVLDGLNTLARGEDADVFLGSGYKIVAADEPIDLPGGGRIVSVSVQHEPIGE